jgi:hypothetical protein
MIPQISGRSHPGRDLVRPQPPPAGRARQEIDYGRRGKGYVFGAFCPATGAAFTQPYPGRGAANWVAFLEEVEGCRKTLSGSRPLAFVESELLIDVIKMALVELHGLKHGAGPPRPVRHHHPLSNCRQQTFTCRPARRTLSSLQNECSQLIGKCRVVSKGEGLEFMPLHLHIFFKLPPLYLLRDVNARCNASAHRMLAIRAGLNSLTRCRRRRVARCNVSCCGSAIARPRPYLWRKSSAHKGQRPLHPALVDGDTPTPPSARCGADCLCGAVPRSASGPVPPLRSKLRWSGPRDCRSRRSPCMSAPPPQ